MSVTRLVPRDSALPSLGELITAPSVPPAVVETLVADGCSDATRGEISYIRYRPGKDCTILWSFRGDGHTPRLISARLFSDDRGLLLQVFPRDHRLNGLESASSAVWVAEQLGALGLHCGDSPVVAVMPGSYKPGIRCVLQYRSAGPGGRLLCLAKVGRADEPPPVGGIVQVAARLRAVSAPWTIAAPIAHVPEANLLLVEPIHDPAPVSGLVERAADDPAARSQLGEVMARAADGLAAFQHQELSFLPVVGPAARVSELEQKIDRVEVVAPELAKRLRAPLHSLERALTELSAEELVLSHGSFRHEHMLLDGARLVAIDLDNLCVAGASADAGSFLSFLDVETIGDDCRRSIADECVNTFVSTLGRNGSANQAWIEWYRAAGHLKWALRSFLSLSPCWPERTEALSLLATATLARLKEGGRSCTR